MDSELRHWMQVSVVSRPRRFTPGIELMVPSDYEAGLDLEPV